MSEIKALQDELQELKNKVQELQDQLQTSSTKYTIQITYQTGDSFNTYDDVSTVGAVWSDLKYAKLALKFIKEHHKYYQESRYYSPSSSPKDVKAAKNSQWYTGDSYSLNVLINENKKQKIHTFWMGFFERIREAKIIIDDSEFENSSVSF